MNAQFLLTFINVMLTISIRQWLVSLGDTIMCVFYMCICVYVRMYVYLWKYVYAHTLITTSRKKKEICTQTKANRATYTCILRTFTRTAKL